MITKFKVFENGNFGVESDYLNKFCVIVNDPDETDNLKLSIMICNRVDFHTDNVFMSFDAFDILKNGKMQTPVGDNSTLTLEELKKIEFLTPIEFYEKYPNECTLLASKIFDEYRKDDNLAYWEIKIIDDCKKLLLTIPEFEPYDAVEKYNL